MSCPAGPTECTKYGYGALAISKRRILLNIMNIPLFLAQILDMAYEVGRIALEDLLVIVVEEMTKERILINLHPLNNKKHHPT